MSNFNTIMNCANNTLLATVNTGNIVNGAVTPVQTANVVPGGTFRNLKIVAAGGAKTETITADAIEVVTSGDTTPFTCTAVSHTLNMANSGVADGIDTGAVAASTLYFTYEIYNGTACHSLASLSSTAPTFPAGYSYKTRTGAFFTDGSSNILAGTQNGRSYQYKVNPLIASGAQGTYSVSVPVWAAQSLTGFIPSTAAKYTVTIASAYNALAASNVIAAPNNGYGGVTSTTPPPCHTPSNVAMVQCAIVYESSTLFMASNQAGAAILALGWDDNL